MAERAAHGFEESLEFYRQVFKQSSTPMCIVSAHSSAPLLLKANPALGELIQQDENDLIDEPIESLCEDFEFIESVRATVEGGDGGTGITTLTGAAGAATRTTVWSMSPIRDPWGETIAVLVSWDDVTDKIADERNLRMLARALNAAGDPILVTNDEHNVVFANTAFEQLTGYTSDEIIGHGPRFLHSARRGKQHTYDDIRTQLDEGHPARIHTNLITQDGPILHVSLSVMPVVGDDGTIENFVAVLSDVSDLVLERDSLARDAATDRLTGLYNRHTGDNALDTLHERLHASHAPYSVVLCDIDHFKNVNDTHGHAIGDRVLVQVAATLNQHARKDDLVVRWGGEEFLILLPNQNATAAMRTAERLRAAVAAEPDPEVGTITMSFGVTEAHPNDPTPHTVVNRADAALYTSKHNGRNTVTRNEPLV